MNKKAQLGSLLLFAMICWTSTHAAEIRPVVKAGAEFGGDTLVTVVFTDGSTDSIKAHEGLTFGGGVSYIDDSNTFEVETTLSYKFTSITADNGDVTWTRFPLDVLAFYRFSNVRLGGGLTYHLSPDISGSGAVGNINANFDNALGFVFQGDYIFRTNRATAGVFVGLRFTSITYKEKTSGISVDSNGAGVQVGYRF